MNLQTITVRPSDVQRKIEAYGRALKRKPNAEYTAILRGYEKLARGVPIIRLTQTIGNAGWDMKGYPRLAVARADRNRVRFRINGDGDATFNSGAEGYSQSATSLLYTVVPNAAFPPRPRGSERFPRPTAIVPLIPPEAAKGRDLSKRLVLFEADWKEPPCDPVLLLPLGGDLYAVEAAWDLTDLERAVIAGTRARIR